MSTGLCHHPDALMRAGLEALPGAGQGPGACPTLTRRPQKDWHSESGCGQGRRAGEGSVLPAWMPASPLPLFSLTARSPLRGQRKLLKTEIRSCHLSA